MRKNKMILFTTVLLLSLLLQYSARAHDVTHKKPAIQLAKTYKKVDDISQYWASEKLDGIRGYWDGKRLITKNGNIIHTPHWFTLNWPDTDIDGELWIARNQFQLTLSCISKVNIDESCWQKVRFMIFDLPSHKGTFTKRINAMKNIIDATQSIYLKVIEQFRLRDTDQLNHHLAMITLRQGEGLMLHLDSASYHKGRTSNILKVKQHQDAEAEVIGYIAGKGKYQGMLGSLKVRTHQGIVFKIGSGFSDEERKNPPKVGSIITFKYNGKTQANIPRFARFFRIKAKELLSIEE